MRKQYKEKPYTRLTQPLVREGGSNGVREGGNNGVREGGSNGVREGGRLRPASWDEALERAADGFRRTVADRGPDAVGCFSCSKATNEMNFIAQKLMRTAIGTNNIDSCNRT